MKTVLTIAGSDSGGGAGIQADIKTFEAHGVFSTTAITAITAQNTMGVQAVFELPVGIVRSQIESVFDDFDVAAIKIGMLSSTGIIKAVASLLEARAAAIPIILDPVMVATSGDILLAADAVASLKSDLTPFAAVITPNHREAEILAGCSINDLQGMRDAAARIHLLGARAVLIKGGDLPSAKGASKKQAVDLLYDGEEYTTFVASFLESRHTHGTGCTLSAAIAASLALGASLVDAVSRGKEYVRRAIEQAPGLGKGHGPLRHRIDVAPR